MDNKKNSGVKPNEDPHSIFNHCSITPFLNGTVGLEKGVNSGTIPYMDFDESSDCNDENIKSLKLYTINFKLGSTSVTPKANQSDNLIKTLFIQQIGTVSVDKAIELGKKHFNEYTKEHGIVWNPNIEPTFENQTQSEKTQFRNASINKLISRIFSLGNMVALSNRRGSAQNILVNVQIASILNDVQIFIPISKNEKDNPSLGTIYKIGNLGDLGVYVNPYLTWDDGTILSWRTGGIKEHGLILQYSKEQYDVNVFAEGVKAPVHSYSKKWSIIEVGNAYKNFMVGKIDIPDYII